MNYRLLFLFVTIGVSSLNAMEQNTLKRKAEDVLVHGETKKQKCCSLKNFLNAHISTTSAQKLSTGSDQEQPIRPIPIRYSLNPHLYASEDQKHARGYIKNEHLTLSALSQYKSCPQNDPHNIEAEQIKQQFTQKSNSKILNEAPFKGIYQCMKHAAQTGDLDTLKKLCQPKPFTIQTNIKIPAEILKNCFALAAGNGQLSILHYLWNQFPNIEFSLIPALRCAVENNHIDTVGWLLEQRELSVNSSSLGFFLSVAVKHPLACTEIIS